MYISSPLPLNNLVLWSLLYGLDASIRLGRKGGTQIKEHPSFDVPRLHPKHIIYKRVFFVSDFSIKRHNTNSLLLDVLKVFYALDLTCFGVAEGFICKTERVLFSCSSLLRSSALCVRLPASHSSLCPVEEENPLQKKVSFDARVKIDGAPRGHPRITKHHPAENSTDPF